MERALTKLALLPCDVRQKVTTGVRKPHGAFEYVGLFRSGLEFHFGCELHVWIILQVLETVKRGGAFPLPLESGSLRAELYMKSCAKLDIAISSSGEFIVIAL